jgi:rhodanese-related sulfurtransferase
LRASRDGQAKGLSYKHQICVGADATAAWAEADLHGEGVGAAQVEAIRPAFVYSRAMKPFFIALLATLALALAAELPSNEMLQPKDVAARLAAAGPKPSVFQVGPNVLYRSNHIPGSIFAGPGSKPEGLDLLKTAVAKLPKDREIILYCGCCPWDRCPNMNPAIKMLKEMGYTRVKAMHVADNFKKDWIDQGYPAEQ